MCVRGGKVPGGGEPVVDGEDPRGEAVVVPRGWVVDIDDDGIDRDGGGRMVDPTPPDGGGGMVDPPPPS
jgi:hypothetical protein